MRYSEMIAFEKRRRARHGLPPQDGAGQSIGQILRVAFVCLGLIGLALLLAGCSSAQYRDPSAAMTTTGPVDLERYQGRWYEIARFPNRFEEGCEGVTAEYTQNPDGTVKVVNTCRQGATDGPVETAEGVATSASPDNDKLLVTFVPWLPFARGDYWILDLDDEYTVVVVGAPSGSTGWILARTPAINEDQKQRALSVLQANGYDTGLLYFTQQPPG